MAYSRLLPVCLFLFLGTPVLAGDPHAPQLNVFFLAQPASIVQYGSTRLVYEMLITNFSKITYVIDAVDTKIGETQSNFTGAPLEAMMPTWVYRKKAWRVARSRPDVA
jgi:hypothetical protein